MNKIRYLFGRSVVALLVLSGCSKPDMTVKPAPGTVAVSSVFNYLHNNFDFSLFAAAVDKSGFADSLASQQQLFTVFTVSNKGMNKLQVFDAKDFNAWGTDSIRRFVRTHLLPGRITYNDIPRSLDTRYKNLNGDDLYVSAFETSVTVNGVPLVPVPVLNQPAGTAPAYGISLLNGMIYPVDAPVKASAATIQQFLASRADLSIFVAGLKKFGLWETVGNTAAITVLAPPDSVFLRYGITLDSINKMDTVRYKKAFMETYVIRLNRVFISDVYSFVNREAVPEIPFASLALLTLPAGDPDLVLCMLGYKNTGSHGFGCFVCNRSAVFLMTNVYGGTYWFYRILGSNATNVPRDEDDQSGYEIPYIGERNKFGNLQGTHINYSLKNGPVHLLSGLLLMPADVKR